VRGILEFPVVLLDPSVSSSSPVTGLRAVTQTGHVIEDVSQAYTAEQWADEAVALAQRHGASLIVYRANRLGDRARAVLNHAMGKARVYLDCKGVYSTAEECDV
jgi:phage terminase large subunit-like protein